MPSIHKIVKILQQDFVHVDTRFCKVNNKDIKMKG